MASASYRFTDVASYPSQLHDVKAAVRWLRGHGNELGLATERIGAWGASAGGYLALMLGLTAGSAELEGSGGNPEQDSSVQAVCDWFAPVDLAEKREPVAPSFRCRTSPAARPPTPRIPRDCSGCAGSRTISRRRARRVRCTSSAPPAAAPRAT